MQTEGTVADPFQGVDFIEYIVQYHKGSRVPPGIHIIANIFDFPQAPLNILFPAGEWEVGPFYPGAGTVVAQVPDSFQIFNGLRVVADPLSAPRGYRQVIDISYDLLASVGSIAPFLKKVPINTGDFTPTTFQGGISRITVDGFTPDDSYYIVPFVRVDSLAHFRGTWSSTVTFVPI